MYLIRMSENYTGCNGEEKPLQGEMMETASVSKKAIVSLMESTKSLKI